MILAAASLLAAQSKPITNADLETYKQDRLKAEREYRENYAKWGFASPEELDRRREESRVATEQLSAKLRAERLERERFEVQQLANAQYLAALARASQVREPQYSEPSYFWSYSYGRRHRYPVVHWPFQQQLGYVGGGQFWPSAPRLGSGPLWVGPRH
jgi:hypothetical protein